MVNRDPADHRVPFIADAVPPLQKRLRALVVWGGLAVKFSVLSVMLQALFGRQLEQLQTIQLGRELALNVRLTELALERYPPHLVWSHGVDWRWQFDRTRCGANIVQASNVRLMPCNSSSVSGCRTARWCCPMGARGERRVWIELISPLEPICCG